MVIFREFLSFIKGLYSALLLLAGKHFQISPTAVLSLTTLSPIMDASESTPLADFTFEIFLSVSLF